MELQHVQPLVIKSGEGSIIDVSLMNEKAFTKSRERGELWHMNRETGRVLPYSEGLEMVSLREQHRWYEAVVEGPSPGAGGDSATAVASAEATHEAAASAEGQEPPREPSQEIPGFFPEEPAALRYGTSQGRLYEPPEAASPSARFTGSVEPAPGCGASLELLEQTVLQRKAELPEGSYTTHLFTSGEEKIRKKAGEEAVEILLAQEDERLVSESADFIYHLLVLLAHRNIPVSAVCAELARRAGESGGSDASRQAQAGSSPSRQAHGGSGAADNTQGQQGEDY